MRLSSFQAIVIFFGDGVEQNKFEAVKWLKKASVQNHADAQSMLAFCYQMGEGVEKNQKTAVRWYRKAAKQDNEKAQKWLENHGLTWQCHLKSNYVQRISRFEKLAFKKCFIRQKRSIKAKEKIE